MSFTRRLIAEVTGEEAGAPVRKRRDPEAERQRKEGNALKRAERGDSDIFRSRFQDRWGGYWKNWKKMLHGMTVGTGDQPQHMWGRGR